MDENKNIEAALTRLQNLKTKKDCVGLCKNDYEYIDIAYETLIAEGINKIVANAIIQSILGIQIKLELV